MNIFKSKSGFKAFSIMFYDFLRLYAQAFKTG